MEIVKDASIMELTRLAGARGGGAVRGGTAVVPGPPGCGRVAIGGALEPLLRPVPP